MNKFVIKKAELNVKRSNSTIIHVDNDIYEGIKELSDKSGYSIQYISNWLLKLAIENTSVIDGEENL